MPPTVEILKAVLAFLLGLAAVVLLHAIGIRKEVLVVILVLMVAAGELF